jgi:tetratricopeptide (TPR) repeat protein
MGTMEIESALVSNPLVAEAAVVGRPDDLTGEAISAFVVLKGQRPADAAKKRRRSRSRSAQLGRPGDRSDRQAQGHPLRRQPAQDPLRQDHAPAAAGDRQGRGDHAGHLDAGEPGDSAMHRRINSWFHRQIALWAFLFGRRDVALDHWRRVRLLSPNDAAVPATIAHLMSLSGQRAAAIPVMEESLAIDPQSAAVWFNLGFLQQEEGLNPQALVSFDRALALDDKLDRAWYGKALSLIKLGRVDEAIPLLKRNTELQPMSPFGWYQLAHAYVRIGEQERARTVIRT